jgi:hypothetical protein
MRAVPPGRLKISISQENVEKCSELDNWSVFQMTLCVACRIVLTMRRFSSMKMNVKNANCTTSSSRHDLDVFGMFFLPLIYARRSITLVENMVKKNRSRLSIAVHLTTLIYSH